MRYNSHIPHLIHQEKLLTTFNEVCLMARVSKASFSNILLNNTEKASFIISSTKIATHTLRNRTMQNTLNISAAQIWFQRY